MAHISEPILAAPAGHLRDEIGRLIEAELPQSASARLAELWHREHGPAAAAFVVSRFEKLRHQLPLRPCRVAVLRSFTVEPAMPLLRAGAFCYGIDASLQIGDFNAYPQEILDPHSLLYQFNPEVVILAITTADCAPELWNNYSQLDADATAAVCQRVSSSFAQWIGAFRAHSQASLIVHNLEQPSRPSRGVLDSQSERGQSAAIQTINRELRRVANEHRGVYVLDYDALVARHGREHWRDERKWVAARMPIAAGQLVQLSDEWLRFLVPLTGRTSKVLVVDLDNTLWGGVVGEDGMAGVRLGPEYPGACYQALQRVMLDFNRRGILLAICSKNNLEDAMEVLQHHPDMVLRLEHFAAMRINWSDKAQGLREIAGELNVSLDSLAFLDDNPVEREQVRVALPEVAVIDLPEDPQQYAAGLRDCPLFERLAISAEDQERTDTYSKQRERAHAEQTFQSKEDFYYFLRQEVEVAAISPAAVGRIAQLTQKTNQFNLTSRRLSEQQVLDMAERPGAQVLSLRVRDRFGDQGLVGVVITLDHDQDCEIHTFLLSCRVIGRTVETAFLSHVAKAAAERGCRRLKGEFVPTRKNAPAQDFYPRHGFQLSGENAEGMLWSLDLRAGRIDCPRWIELRINTGGRVEQRDL